MDVQLNMGRSRARISIALTGILLYGALVAMVTLTPSPVEQGFEHNVLAFLDMLHNRGIPESFGFNELESTANVLMFLPLGFFVSLALPTHRQWLSALILPSISVGIELSQHLFLPARFATVEDVIANSVGGLIGMVIAVLLRSAVHRRDAILRDR